MKKVKLLKTESDCKDIFYDKRCLLFLYKGLKMVKVVNNKKKYIFKKRRSGYLWLDVQAVFLENWYYWGSVQ